MSSVSFGPAGTDAASRSEEVRLLGHLMAVEPASGPAGIGLRRQAMIDTGASDICIDYRLAERLNLTPVDQRSVGVVGGANVQATVYKGVLRVPELNYEAYIPLFGMRLRRPTYDVLIGRSFLQQFIVTLDGPEGVFHFQKPARDQASEPFDE